MFLQIANLSRENRVLMVKLKKIGKTGYMESEVSPKSDQSSHKLQATITPLTNQEVKISPFATKNMYLQASK